MLKKILSIFAIAVIMLTGCMKTTTEGYISYINEFGPNEIECNSFYHYMYVEGGCSYSGLMRYDLTTESDQEIYRVDDLKNQRITSFWGDDDGVFFVVKSVQGKDAEMQLFYYDLNSNQKESLLSSEDSLTVYKDSSTKRIMVTEGTQKYYIDDGSLQLAENKDIEAKSLHSDESSIELVDDNGTKIVISKEYDKKEFTYTVDGMTTVIDALSDCGGEKSGVSYTFAIEGSKVIGVVQITKGGSGYGGSGIIPSNILPADKLKKEVLVSFDYKTGESEILYNTKNNSIRIIGYSNGKVFLLNNNIITSKSLSDGNEKEIYTLSYDGDGQITFNWIGSRLVIFDEDYLQVIANIQT